MNDDTISRQAAIDATELLIKDFRKDAVDVMNFGHNYNHGVADAIATLKHLPSAERRGQWENIEHAPNDLLYATCSVCGKRQTVEATNYCGNCGARMEEEA